MYLDRPNEYSIDAAVALVVSLVGLVEAAIGFILRALNDQPRNTNQLSNDLDLNYKTVQHHRSPRREQYRDHGGRQLRADVLPLDRMMNNLDIMEDVAEQAGVDDDS